MQLWQCIIECDLAVVQLRLDSNECKVRGEIDLEENPVTGPRRSGTKPSGRTDIFIPQEMMT